MNENVFSYSAEMYKNQSSVVQKNSNFTDCDGTLYLAAEASPGMPWF